jgi:hypothetical protein
MNIIRMTLTLIQIIINFGFTEIYTNYAKWFVFVCTSLDLANNGEIKTKTQQN